MSFQLVLTLVLVCGAALWLASRAFRRPAPGKPAPCGGCTSHGCPACPKGGDERAGASSSMR